MLIALRETLSNNPDTASSDLLNLAKKKARRMIHYRVDIGRKITLRDVPGVGSSRKKDCASSQMSCRARHLRLPCYKLDIGLSFVKSGLSGTDSPRGRTRLRLVRPLGLSVPDKPLITQAAADIYNMLIDLLIIVHVDRRR